MRTETLNVAKSGLGGVGWETRRAGRLGALAALALAGAACAQVQIVNENFDSGQTNNWLANGQNFTFNDPRGGLYLGVPYLDFFGMNLRYDVFGPVTGDLTRHTGPMEFGFDVRVFAFDNFAGEPIDPAFRSLVLQLHDRGDPNDFSDDVSVWYQGPVLPQIDQEWQRMTFTIPIDFAGPGLPAGWSGTGAEDPVTGEPMFPAGRTWRSVMENVEEFSVTTFVPGFFYGFAFYDFGWDNVTVEVAATSGVTCDGDLTGDGFVDDSDFVIFAAAYENFECTPACPADFNKDGFVDDADFVTFAAAYEAFACAS